MVDVGHKPIVHRRAVAEAVVRMAPASARALLDGTLPKGDAAAVARVAGIMAAKRTPELIALCHPLPLTRVAAEFEIDATGPRIVCRVTAETLGPTGVEMEALTAVQIGLLTIYDMCKAADRGMVIDGVRLIEKRGGKSGSFVADAA